MSNDLIIPNSGGLLALMDQLPDIADSLSNELGIGSIGTVLKFDGRTGIYTLNGEVIQKDSEFAFLFSETKKSKICWKGKRPVARHEELVFSGKKLPTDAELEDFGPYEEGEGWQNSISFTVLSFLDGQQASFTLTSWGGRSAADALFKKWFVEQRMQLDDNGKPLTPVIRLGSDKKVTKTGNTIYVPVFTITAWLSDEEMADELGGPPAPVPPKAAPKAAPKAVGFGSGVRGRRTA